MKRRKIISLLFLAVMITSLLSMSAAADGTENYLALGDSISAGYGLETPDTQGFVSIVGKDMEYSVSNKSISGQTADDVRTQLESGMLDEDIRRAATITITCGGNDLMAVLYNAIAEHYNDNSKPEGAADLTGNDIVAIIADTNIGMFGKLVYINSALGILQATNPAFHESEAFTGALNKYMENLKNIVGYIDARNPDAAVIVATQYNPYKCFLAENAGTDMLAIVHSAVENGILALNDAIKGAAVSTGYIVTDVYTAFAGSTENLCNASFDLSTFSVELDFHPNAAGHAVIADTVKGTINCEHTVENNVCTKCFASIAAKVELSGTETYHTTLAKAFAQAQSGTAQAPALITLLDDVNESVSAAGGTFTLDLNNCVVTGRDGNSVITVNDGAVLTIADSSEEKSTRYGQWNDDNTVYTIYDDAGNTYDELVGGSIAGGDASGIYIAGGDVTVLNCTVTGNRAEGIELAAGKLTLRDSTVTGNGNADIRIEKNAVGLTLGGKIKIGKTVLEDGVDRDIVSKEESLTADSVLGGLEEPSVTGSVLASRFDPMIFIVVGAGLLLVLIMITIKKSKK